MAQRALHTAQILWPAFLVAGLLEMAVFSWADPGLLRFGNWQPDPQIVYSLGFFAFWALVALASALSHWMMAAPRLPSDDHRVRRYARKQTFHHQV
jgi:hypothetical protein